MGSKLIELFSELLHRFKKFTHASFKQLVISIIDDKRASCKD